MPRLGLGDNDLLFLAVGLLLVLPRRPADFFVPFLGLDLKPFRLVPCRVRPLPLLSLLLLSLLLPALDLYGRPVSGVGFSPSESLRLPRMVLRLWGRSE